MAGAGGRSLQELLGSTMAASFGNPGPGAARDALILGAKDPNEELGNVGIGSETGAPPWTRFRLYQIAPYQPGNPNFQPTNVVEADRQPRIVIFTAPFVGFSVYVGDPSVSPAGSGGFALPPGLPYEVIIPGNQHIYAVTDAPTFLPLRVQISALLLGGRERRYTP